MAMIRTVGILAVIIALIFGVAGYNSQNVHTKHNDHGHGHGHGHGHDSNNNNVDSSEEQKPCSDDAVTGNHLPPCSSPSIPTSPEVNTVESTADDSTEEISDTNSPVTTAGPSSLERAHWCRLPNSTYLPFNFTFIHTTCSVCKCTASRIVRCQPLQCMPTYCFDNSSPHRETGECCTRCRQDTATNTSCLYNDLYYPHGSILKTVEGKMQCWCQLGNIECRTPITSMLGTIDALASGAVIYLIVMVFFILLIIGSLFCCGFSLIFYHYYQRNQQQFQETYDQYVNSAGWQPMEDGEEYMVDEKALEAEKSQHEDSVTEGGPPAYDTHFIDQDKKQ